MVRYLCQSCNCTYVDNHKCFSYKNYDNPGSLPQKEKDKKDTKNGKTKDDFATISKGKSVKLIPLIQLSDTEELEQVNYPITKNNDQVSFDKASEGQGNLSSLSDVTFNNAHICKPDGVLASKSTVNSREDAVHFEEKDYPECSSQNVGLFGRFKRDLYGVCTEKSSVPFALRDKRYGETKSSSDHETLIEESEIFLDKILCQSFTKDKVFAIKSKESAPQDVHMDSKTILRTSNILYNNAIVKDNKELDRCTVEKSTPSKVDSNVLETSENLKKNLFSKKEKESNKYTFEESRNLSDIPMPSKRIYHSASGLLKLKEPPDPINEKESNKYTLRESWDLPDISISKEVTSPGRAKSATNMKKPLASIKEREFDKYIFEVSRKLPDIPSPPKVVPHDFAGRSDNMKEDVISVEEKECEEYTFEVSRKPSDLSNPSKVVPHEFAGRSDNMKEDAFSVEEKECDEYTYEVSGKPSDLSSPPKVVSYVFARRSTYMEEDLASVKEKQSEKLTFKGSDELQDISKPDEIPSHVLTKNENSKKTVFSNEKKSVTCTLKASKETPDIPISPKVNLRILTRSADNISKILVNKKVEPSENHINMFKTKNGPFACNLCKRQFPMMTSLKKHYWKHAYKKKCFICDVCDRKFTLKTNLNIHYRTHAGEKPFVCEFCEKRFTSKSALAPHYRTHTGEKPFKCEICEKAFSRRGNCNVHLKTHK